MTQWGLDTLFNPAKRHMDEEKRRLQSTREEVGDSSGGKRIDLESGKVTIRRAKDASGRGRRADEAEARRRPQWTTPPTDARRRAATGRRRAARRRAEPRALTPPTGRVARHWR